MIELATYVAVNDYEAKLLSNKTGWSIDEMLSRVEALVITRGEHGRADFCTLKASKEIPAVKAQKSRRSDRLRRRVPRWLAVWHREQAGLGENRSSGEPDGRAENRTSGTAGRMHPRAPRSASASSWRFGFGALRFFHVAL